MMTEIFAAKVKVYYDFFLILICIEEIHVYNKKDICQNNRERKKEGEEKIIIHGIIINYTKNFDWNEEWRTDYGWGGTDKKERTDHSQNNNIHKV